MVLWVRFLLHKHEDMCNQFLRTRVKTAYDCDKFVILTLGESRLEIGGLQELANQNIQLQSIIDVVSKIYK
jgi:hypothetical protein